MNDRPGSQRAVCRGEPGLCSYGIPGREYEPRDDSSPACKAIVERQKILIDCSAEARGHGFSRRVQPRLTARSGRPRLNRGGSASFAESDSLLNIILRRFTSRAGACRCPMT